MAFVPINLLNAKNVRSQDIFYKPSLLSTITGPVSDMSRVITLIYTGQHHLKQGGFFFIVYHKGKMECLCICASTQSQPLATGRLWTYCDCGYSATGESGSRFSLYWRAAFLLSKWERVAAQKNVNLRISIDCCLLFSNYQPCQWYSVQNNSQYSHVSGSRCGVTHHTATYLEFC